MIPIDSQQLESFVPVYDVVPEKWEEARQFLIEHLKKISNAVNSREIGFFLDQELLTGKAFIPGITQPGQNPGQFRQILRVVVDCGPMPGPPLPGPPYTKMIPHNIVFDSNFTLTQMWGSCTDPTNLVAFTYGYAPSTVAGGPFGVQVFLSGPNIVITTNSSRTTYTRNFVFIEYTQEL